MTDLYKQQQLFNLLKDDEILFREFLDNSKDSIILIDKNKKILDWNNASEELTGIPKEEVINNEILPILTTLIPKLDHSKKLKDAAIKIIENYILKGERTNQIINLRIVTSKGEKKIISSLITFFKFKEKNGVGIISRDITKQLEADKKTKQNEKYLNIIFDNDSIGIVFYNLQSGIINANDKFLKISGYSLEELKKSTIDNLTYSDDLENDKFLFKETFEIKGKKYSLVKRIIRKDKSLVWVKENITFKWSKDNELEMVFGFVEDITLQKNAEEALCESEYKYRFIAEKASDIIYSISLDSKITFYNRVIERVLDITKEEIEQHKYDHLMIPKDKEFAKKLHQDRLAGKTAPLFVQGFQTSKGKIVYLEISVNPLFDDNKNVIGSLGIARDVTDRINAEEALNDKNIELENLIKTKDRLLSIIAHDLKGSFNNLLGFSELLLENFEHLSEKEKKTYIESINLSAIIGYDLLKNLLDWTLAQTGKLVYRPELLILNKTIKNVVYSIKQSALIKNIDIVCQKQKQISVFNDEILINTVFRNLLSNAIKFSHPNNKILIEIEESQLEFIIHIKDFGAGIKAEELNKIFTPDDVVINKGTLNEKGTGLGLNICKEFVNLWGGKIWAESTYEKGSTFSFSIPK